MKTLVAAGLSAALLALPATGALAQEIKPVDPTVSTQSLVPAALAGGLAPGAVILGTIVLAGVVYLIVDATNGT